MGPLIKNRKLIWELMTMWTVSMDYISTSIQGKINKAPQKGKSYKRYQSTLYLAYQHMEPLISMTIDLDMCLCQSINLDSILIINF